MTDKQRAIDTIAALPEQTSMRRIAEELEIMAAIRDGEEAADAGRLTPHDEVKRLLTAWTAE